MEKRYFFFLYPMNFKIRDLLNLAIFALNPYEKWPAHVTVAGPFGSRRNLRNQAFKATLVCLGISNFFDVGANTVYLRVGAYNIWKYWQKPGFNTDPVPHLTLYDGPDAEWARKAFAALERVKAYFSFPVDGVNLVASFSGQQNSMLRERVNPQCLPRTANLRLDEIAALSREDRLSIAVEAISRCADEPPA